MQHSRAISPYNRSVLLCNPLGQESVRLHRFYRVLAERLSRLGIAVLRFGLLRDGESAGEEVEGRLARWCDDVLEAHRELIRLSGAKKISLDRRSPRRFDRTPGRYPPVWPRWIDSSYGNQFWTVRPIWPSLLKTMRAPWPARACHCIHKHRLDLMAKPGLCHEPGPDRRHRADQRPRPDAGHAGTHDLGNRPTRRHRSCRHRAGRPSYPANTQHQALSVPFAWTSEEALNTSLVPPAALQALSQLDGGRPLECVPH